MNDAFTLRSILYVCKMSRKVEILSIVEESVRVGVICIFDDDECVIFFGSLFFAETLVTNISILVHAPMISSSVRTLINYLVWEIIQIIVHHNKYTYFTIEPHYVAITSCDSQLTKWTYTNVHKNTEPKMNLCSLYKSTNFNVTGLQFLFLVLTKFETSVTGIR